MDIDDIGENVRKSFTHVRVVHNFRGSNNDELCMKKDDVCIVLVCLFV